MRFEKLQNYVQDGLKNLISGLGTTGYDKSASNQYYIPIITDEQLVAAYRSDWVAGKIVDIPAADSCREWRNWQAEKDQISKLVEEEKKFNLKQKVQDALIKSRLLGGAAIYMGIDGTGEPSEELNLEKIRQGSLKYIHVLDKNEITAGQIIRDLQNPYYGEPEKYSSTDSKSGQILEIHPSRVIRFVGKKLPTRSLQDSSSWGDSVLLRLDQAIKSAGLASEGIATLINEAAVDVIKIPDLMNNISTEEYKNRLMQRFSLAMVNKSMNRSLMLDSEEEYDKKQVNFSGLPDVIRVYLIIASGAGDIPATRLLGQSPQGLNATGDSDLRNYYDNVGAEQKNTIEPILSTLDEVLIRSALGSRPDEIHYNWLPLWQMTQSEKSTVSLNNSQTVANIYNTGLVPDEVLAKGVENMLIEDGIFPGLESAIDDYSEMDLEEDDPEVTEQFNKSKKPVDDPNQQTNKENNLMDAEPRTLYISRKVLNGEAIVNWFKQQGIENIVPAEKMHVTIAFSRTPVDWMKISEAWSNEDGKIKVSPGGPRLLDKYGKTSNDLVLMFNSIDLKWRHEQILELGASWDWEDYQPHITINYGDDINPENIDPYIGEILLGPEIFEEVIENWKENINQ